MKHDIIKTDNYLLVVDESEIKGWYYDAYINKVKHSGGAEYGESIITRNIIAHLPLNDSPILEGVDLLPPLEAHTKVNFDDLVFEAYQSQDKYTVSEINKGFELGYLKAKEKYKYTEEDLRRAWNAAYIDAISIDEETYKPLFYEDFIQSLSEPKMPIRFECVTQKLFKHNKFMERAFYDSILTTTTPEGHTQWVGTYIFN